MSSKPDQRKKTKELRPRGIVAELAGLLAGVEIDKKESYAEYLAKKYS